MAKKKIVDDETKILITAWVKNGLRTQANIAAQLDGESITDTIIKALEAKIAKVKL